MAVAPCGVLPGAPVDLLVAENLKLHDERRPDMRNRTRRGPPKPPMRRGIVSGVRIYRLQLDQPVTAPVAPSPSPTPLPAHVAEPAPEVSARSARVVALVVALAMVALLALMVWGIGKRAAGTVG